uniref:Uncharacterized protein n=1 Tax=viral metagenome TaxID=1070528 RepID=A0A6C0HNF1_9ZZZZ
MPQYTIKHKKNNKHKKNKKFSTKHNKKSITIKEQNAGFRFWVSKEVEIFYHREGMLSITNAYASNDLKSAPTINSAQLLNLPKFRFRHLKVSGNYLIGARFQKDSRFFFIIQFILGFGTIIGDKKENVIVPLDAKYIQSEIDKRRQNIVSCPVEYIVYSLHKNTQIIPQIAIEILRRGDGNKLSRSRYSFSKEKTTTGSIEAHEVGKQYFIVKFMK